jgi:phage baseplate assembly protein gpV
MALESPLRYFDAAPVVRVRAGEREIASATVDSSREWSVDVPADALRASSGAVTIDTDKTFVPAERGTAADRRRLGLRVFAIRVSER